MLRLHRKCGTRGKIQSALSAAGDYGHTASCLTLLPENWRVLAFSFLRASTPPTAPPSPRSGMLPGYVSGFYSYDDCHIDLAVLAAYSSARLIHAEASGIDLASRQVKFASRPPVSYDVLSIDIGITPGRSSVPGAAALATPVKPIDKFVHRLDELLAAFRASAAAATAAAAAAGGDASAIGVVEPMTFVVVGGGAGGVEVAMALQV